MQAQSISYDERSPIVESRLIQKIYENDRPRYIPVLREQKT
jgi:hypothetical protein